MTEESTPFQAVQLEYTSFPATHCWPVVYALSEYNDHLLIAVNMTGAQYITSTHFVKWWL